jgi:predicted PurR-regulated permease PerM
MDNTDIHITKNKVLRLVLYIIIVIIAVSSDAFTGFVKSVLYTFRPIILGMAAAFVLNRPVCRIFDILKKALERIESRKGSHSRPFLYRITRTGIASGSEHYRSLWITSVVLGYVILLLIASGIMWFIMPQLYESVKALSANADIYKEKITLYYNAMEKKDSLGILPLISSALTKISDILPSLWAGIYGKTADFLSCLTDCIIGIVISVYILVCKESLKHLVQQISAKIMKSETFARYAAFYRMVYDIFSRFVSGQVTESAILGVLCYIGMKLLRFDYALLISTIIAITALIPVVGAIVGTIPCAFLLFLVKPISAVWFIVFIILLQQLENNFIYPKIVGKSMGLPPLPVLIAIIIGARIGGAAGILLAVPLTAVIYGIVKEKLAL